MEEQAMEQQKLSRQVRVILGGLEMAGIVQSLASGREYVVVHPLKSAGGDGTYNRITSGAMSRMEKK